MLPGTVDALWLRAFHAVVPGAIAAFRPQIIISQCGVDSHREDPLADLALTVDGQRAAFLAMRDLADRYSEGRWLAVGGGGYGLVRVVPRAWTHLIAAALDREIDVDTAVPEDWKGIDEAASAERRPPADHGGRRRRRLHAVGRPGWYTGDRCRLGGPCTHPHRLGDHRHTSRFVPATRTRPGGSP